MCMIFRWHERQKGDIRRRKEEELSNENYVGVQKHVNVVG